MLPCKIRLTLVALSLLHLLTLNPQFAINFGVHFHLHHCFTDGQHLLIYQIIQLTVTKNIQATLSCKNDADVQM